MRRERTSTRQIQDGHTPLTRSAERGDAANCKVLLDAGADIGAYPEEGLGALALAAAATRVADAHDTVEVLMAHQPPIKKWEAGTVENSLESNMGHINYSRSEKAKQRKILSRVRKAAEQTAAEARVLAQPAAGDAPCSGDVKAKYP